MAGQNSFFFGRDKERSWLKEKLQDSDTRVIQVLGRRQIGKTKLVRKVLLEIQGELGDTVDIYKASCGNIRELRDWLLENKFLGAIKSMGTCDNQKNTILVIRQIWKFLEGEESQTQLVELLYELFDCEYMSLKLVLLSRKRIMLPRLDLRSSEKWLRCLEKDDAKLLLKRSSGDVDVTGEADEICERCGYLPHPLAVIGKLFRDYPSYIVTPQYVLESLRDDVFGAVEMSSMAPQDKVLHEIKQELAELPEEEMADLSSVSHLAESFSRDRAVAEMRKEGAPALRSLVDLHNSGLVEGDAANKRFMKLPPLLKPAMQKEGLCSNLLPSQDKNGLHMRCSHEAVEMAKETDAASQGAVVASALTPRSVAHSTQGEHQVGRESLREALSINESQKSTHPTTAVSHSSLDLNLYGKGDKAGALKEYKQAALELRGPPGGLTKQDGLATCLYWIGRILMETDQMDEAEPYLHEALEIRKSLRYLHAETATFLRVQGQLFSKQGKYQEAVTTLEEELRIHGELKTCPVTQGFAEVLLAGALWKLGEFEKAWTLMAQLVKRREELLKLEKDCTIITDALACLREMFMYADDHFILARSRDRDLLALIQGSHFTSTAAPTGLAVSGTMEHFKALLSPTWAERDPAPRSNSDTLSTLSATSCISSCYPSSLQTTSSSSGSFPSLPSWGTSSSVSSSQGCDKTHFTVQAFRQAVICHMTQVLMAEYENLRELYGEKDTEKKVEMLSREIELLTQYLAEHDARSRDQQRERCGAQDQANRSQPNTPKTSGLRLRVPTTSSCVEGRAENKPSDNIPAPKRTPCTPRSGEATSEDFLAKYLSSSQEPTDASRPRSLESSWNSMPPSLPSSVESSLNALTLSSLLSFPHPETLNDGLDDITARTRSMSVPTTREEASGPPFCTSPHSKESKHSKASDEPVVYYKAETADASGEQLQRPPFARYGSPGDTTAHPTSHGRPNTNQPVFRTVYVEAQQPQSDQSYIPPQQHSQYIPPDASGSPYPSTSTTYQPPLPNGMLSHQIPPPAAYVAQQVPHPALPLPSYHQFPTQHNMHPSQHNMHSPVRDPFPIPMTYSQVPLPYRPPYGPTYQVEPPQPHYIPGGYQYAAGNHANGQPSSLPPSYSSLPPPQSVTQGPRQSHYAPPLQGPNPHAQHTGYYSNYLPPTHPSGSNQPYGP